MIGPDTKTAERMHVLNNLLMRTALREQFPEKLDRLKAYYIATDLVVTSMRDALAHMMDMEDVVDRPNVCGICQKEIMYEARIEIVELNQRKGYERIRTILECPGCGAMAIKVTERRETSVTNHGVTEDDINGRTMPKV